MEFRLQPPKVKDMFLCAKDGGCVASTQELARFLATSFTEAGRSVSYKKIGTAGVTLCFREGNPNHRYPTEVEVEEMLIDHEIALKSCVGAVSVTVEQDKKFDFE